MCHQSCKTGEIGTYWSGFGTNYHAAILLRAHLVVFVILILCNAAAAAVVPRLYAPAPRGAVVRPTHNLLTRWLSLHISLSPLGSPARQRSYISSVCTPCHCLCYRHEKSSCYVFFLLPPAFDTMFIPTFQPVPWQQVSAYWVTCLTPSVEPTVERPAQRWRQVGELCTTQTTQEQHLLFIWQGDGTGLS